MRARGVRNHRNMASATKPAFGEPEREITKAVVRRFMDRDEPTSELDLMRDLKPLRAVISDSLSRLVNQGVLRLVNNTYSQETYSPRPLAFRYSGNDELQFA